MPTRKPKAPLVMPAPQPPQHPFDAAHNVDTSGLTDILELAALDGLVFAAAASRTAPPLMIRLGFSAEPELIAGARV